MKIFGKKIILFVGDGIIAHSVASPLIQKMVNLGIEPVIIETGSAKSEKANIPEFTDIKFYETTLLKRAVIPFLNKTFSQDYSNVEPKENVLHSYEYFSMFYGLEHYKVDNINSKEFRSYIDNDENIIGGISIRNYQIFKLDIIDLMNKKGFLWNLHTGLLPKYKGVFIPYRVIENKESSFGWTLHSVDEKIDTGAIIASTYLHIDHKDPVFDIYLDMSECGVVLIEKTLMSILRHGHIDGEAQPKNNIYYSFPTSEEMQKFSDMGVRYIASSKSALDTYIFKFFQSSYRQSEELYKHMIECVMDYERTKVIAEEGLEKKKHSA